MSLTRANIEAELVPECRRWLAYAGLDATTVNGTNAALNGPLREALASVGAATAADVLPGDVSQVFDVCRYRILMAVLGNRASPDTTAGTENVQLHGKFFDSLRMLAADLRADLELRYGYGVPHLSAGVIDLGFAATTDRATGRPV